jgi:hypothetical protein
MKIRFLVKIFCILVVVGNVSAQNHNWVEIRTPFDYLAYGSSSIDTNNIKRLPNGNVTYFKKTPGYTIYQYEVDCQAKQRRVLSETKLDYRDAYGNLVRATPSNGSYPSKWGNIHDGDGSPADYVDYFAARACSEAPKITQAQLEKQKIAQQQRLDEEKREDEGRKCNLTIEQSPKIRGFYLGMSVNDLFSILPVQYAEEEIPSLDYFSPTRMSWKQSIGKTSNDVIGNSISGIINSVTRVGNDNNSFKLCGLKEYIYTFSQDKNQQKYDALLAEKFSGIHQLNFLTVNNRIIGYSVGYDSSKQFSSTKEFISTLAETLTLPKYWNESDGNYSASCRGFNTTAQNRVIEFIDVDKLNEIMNSCVKPAREKEGQKKIFKP